MGSISTYWLVLYKSLALLGRTQLGSQEQKILCQGAPWSPCSVYSCPGCLLLVIITNSYFVIRYYQLADHSNILYAAIELDPEMRLQYFEYEWNDPKEWIQLFKMWMWHDEFYVDNTSQVRGGLRGTHSKEVKKGLIGVPVLNSSKPGGW